MKAIIASGILCLFMAFKSPGQQNRTNEIQIGTGLWTGEYKHLRLLSNSFRIDETPPLARLNALFITYRWSLSERFSLGITNGITQSHTLEERPHDRYRSLMLAVEPQFRYFQRPMLTLYSQIGLGGVISYTEDSGNQNTNRSGYFTPLALQLTPFGIRYGKTFGAYLEAGYGYKGIVNAGISGRF